MPKPPRPWIVTPHQTLTQLDDSLWEIVGDVPGFPPGSGFDRRMCIVRLADGRLVFHNAIPVDEPTLAAIRALGTPAILVVPHHLHAIDARAFREKLGLAVYTSGKSIAKVREILPVDGPVESMPLTPGDPTLAIELLPGSKFGEPVLVVRSGPRVSLVLCDLVINVRHGRGFSGFMFRLLGFTSDEPKLPLPVRLRAFPDKPAVRADLLRLAAIPGLHRVVPSHGPVITDDPAGTLRRIAQSF